MSNSFKITPCLWFDGQAEEAARFYVSIFPRSRIVGESHYSDAGREIHQKPAGSVMTVAFELQGEPFTALNGGPQFKFSEAVSFQVPCETQAEIDHYWRRLSEGGDPTSQRCGWLKDQFGVSWQVFPRRLPRMLGDADPSKSQRVMKAMLEMAKIDIEGLQRALVG